MKGSTASHVKLFCICTVYVSGCPTTGGVGVPDRLIGNPPQPVVPKRRRPMIPPAKSLARCSTLYCPLPPRLHSELLNSHGIGSDPPGWWQYHSPTKKSHGRRGRDPTATTHKAARRVPNGRPSYASACLVASA